MDQFKDGLEAVGIVEYLKKYYDHLTPLFVNESQSFTASKRHFCKSVCYVKCSL